MWFIVIKGCVTDGRSLGTEASARKSCCEVFGTHVLASHSKSRQAQQDQVSLIESTLRYKIASSQHQPYSTTDWDNVMDQSQMRRSAGRVLLGD
jgi:hypothetical protein